MYDPLVVGRNLSRDFPAGEHAVRRVLDGACCIVMPGDRIALTGASGSGKSTLLNILGGFDEPSAGDVCWPGLDVDVSVRRSSQWFGSSRLRPRQRRRPHGVGFVFQSASLLPALDVRQNVSLPLMLSGESKGMEARVRRLLDALDLGRIADNLPGELSGGQAQRVSMARALVIRPRLILADEPTGQLDHHTAGQMLDAVLDIIADSRAALVIASHDEEVAVRLERRWQIARGHLQTGQDEEIVA